MAFRDSLTKCIAHAVHLFESGYSREIVIIAAERAKYYAVYDIAEFQRVQEKLIRQQHRILFHGSGGEMRQFLLSVQLNLWTERLEDEQTPNLPTGK